MKYKVLKKQKSSKLCFACGVNNEIGTHSFYYELENGDLITEFFSNKFYQSYPGRLHGGIAATMLDETMGRTILISEPDTWGVTTRFNLTYKKPIPLEQKIKVVARIIKNTSRAFDAQGEIILPDGKIAVTAQARYVKLPAHKITDTDMSLASEMFVLPDKNDPVEFEY